MPTLAPYPGLRPFNDTEAIFFKGRDSHIELLTRKLEQNKFLMVSGSSGDGKSSLIYAGLIPNLLAGFIKTKFTNWKIVAFRPGRNPLDNLAISLARAFGQDRHEYIVTNMHAGYSALVDLYKNTHLYVDKESVEWNSLQDPLKHDTYRKASNLLIIADQFEEFFTNPENYNRNNQSPSSSSIVTIRVFQETVKIARNSGVPVFIICTIRSDFIGQCTAFDGFPELVAESEYFVPRLNRYEIMQAIEEPAILNGNRISKRLVNRLLNDVGSGQDVLPILQHCLFLIWKMAEDGKEEMDLIHYAKVGGIDGKELPPDDKPVFIEWFNQLSPDLKKLYNKPGLRNVLNIHADSLYENLTPFTNENGTVVSRDEMKETIEITFRCLTKIDDNRAIRNPMTLEEVTSMNNKQMDHETVLTVLNSFRTEGNNFIYPFIGENDENKFLRPETNLDITHEALIRNWQRLDKWVWDENKLVTIYHEFTLQLNKWLQNNKSKEYIMAIGSVQYFESAIHQIKMPFYSWLMRYIWSEGEVPEAYDIHYGSYYARRDALKKRDVKVKQHLSDIKEYFEQSKGHYSRKRRFEKVGITAITLLLIASLVSFFIVLKQNKEKDITAKSIEIATKAQMVLENNPTLAFRLAEESYKIEKNKLASQIITKAFSNPPFYKIAKTKFAPEKIKFSFSGDYIYSFSYSNIMIWNLLNEPVLIDEVYNRDNIVYKLNLITYNHNLLLINKKRNPSIWDLKGNQLFECNNNQNPTVFVNLTNSRKEIISGTTSGTIHLWDLNGNEKLKFPAHKGEIYLIEQSADDSFLVSLSVADNMLKIWDKKGTLLNKILHIPFKDRIQADISPDNQYIVVAFSSTEPILWRWRKNEITYLKGHSDQVWSACFSPDGNNILTSSVDNSAIIWNLEGKQTRKLLGHAAKLWTAKFSPKGDKIITTSDDCTAKIWDLKGNLIYTLRGHGSQIYDADFSPDQKLVATASLDQTIRIWNIKPSENYIIKDHYSWVDDIDVSNDGKYIATCGYDYTGRIWTNQGNPVSVLYKHDSYGVYSVRFLNDNKRILTAGKDGTTRLWDISGKPLKVFESVEENPVESLEVAFNDQYVLGNSYTQKTFLWNINGNLIHTFDNCNVARFSQGNDTRILLAADNSKHQLNIFSIQKDDKHESDTCVFLSTIASNYSGYSGAKFSPDSKFIAFLTRSDSTILLKMEYQPVIRNKKILATKKAGTCLSFSHTGNLFATGTESNSMILWDTSGNQRKIMTGHTNIIRDIAFSWDDKFIASCGNDFTVRIWDLEGNEKQNISVHNAQVIRVLFSKDNKNIISCSNDMTARITPIETEDIVRKVSIEKVYGDVMELSEENKKMYGIK